MQHSNSLSDSFCNIDNSLHTPQNIDFHHSKFSYFGNETTSFELNNISSPGFGRASPSPISSPKNITKRCDRKLLILNQIQKYERVMNQHSNDLPKLIGSTSSHNLKDQFQSLSKLNHLNTKDANSQKSSKALAKESFSENIKSLSGIKANNAQQDHTIVKKIQTARNHQSPLEKKEKHKLGKVALTSRTKGKEKSNLIKSSTPDQKKSNLNDWNNKSCIHQDQSLDISKDTQLLKPLQGLSPNIASDPIILEILAKTQNKQILAEKSKNNVTNYNSNSGNQINHGNLPNKTKTKSSTPSPKIVSKKYSQPNNQMQSTQHNNSQKSLSKPVSYHSEKKIQQQEIKQSKVLTQSLEQGSKLPGDSIITKNNPNHYDSCKRTDHDNYGNFIHQYNLADSLEITDHSQHNSEKTVNNLKTSSYLINPNRGSIRNSTVNCMSSSKVSNMSIISGNANISKDQEQQHNANSIKLNNDEINNNNNSNIESITITRKQYTGPALSVNSTRASTMLHDDPSLLENNIKESTYNGHAYYSSLNDGSSNDLQRNSYTEKDIQIDVKTSIYKISCSQERFETFGSGRDQNLHNNANFAKFPIENQHELNKSQQAQEYLNNTFSRIDISETINDEVHNSNEIFEIRNHESLLEKENIKPEPLSKTYEIHSFERINNNNQRNTVQSNNITVENDKLLSDSIIFSVNANTHSCNGSFMSTMSNMSNSNHQFLKNQNKESITLQTNDPQNKLNERISKRHDSKQNIIKENGNSITSRTQSYKVDCLDGSYYEGDMKCGKREGYGVLKTENGNKIYEGYWKNDNFHGKGIEYNQYNNNNNNNNNNAKSKQIRDNLPFLKENNTWIRYEGDFKNGTWDGLGKLFLNKNEEYYGEFKENKLEGKGTYYSMKGDIIMGIWENSKIFKNI